MVAPAPAAQCPKVALFSSFLHVRGPGGVSTIKLKEDTPSRTTVADLARVMGLLDAIAIA
jgi:hypothetical protein